MPLVIDFGNKMIANEIFCNRHEFCQKFVTHVVGYIFFFFFFVFAFKHFVAAENQNETEDVQYPCELFNNAYAQEDEDETQYNSGPDPPCQCAVLIVNRYTESGKYSDKYKQVVDT